MRLRARGADYDFGVPLTEEELQWITCEVRNFLGLPQKDFPLPVPRDSADSA